MSVSAREDEQVLEQRRRAEESRALAAEHRARAHELRAGGSAGEEDEDVDSDAFLHAGIEEVLADIAELRAAGFDERAASCEALGRAEISDAEEREALLRQASASVIRAAEFEAQAIELRDELAADEALHEALSEAAMARARAREQRALAEAAISELAPADGTGSGLEALRAERHQAWAELHERLALAHRLRGEGLSELAEASYREADRLRQLAVAADERLLAAEPNGSAAEAVDATV